MFMRFVSVVCLSLAAALVLSAQQPGVVGAQAPRPSVSLSQQQVDRTHSYHRILAIVPLTGSGTAADPKRPTFAPAPTASAQDRGGIIAWQYQVSDDGTMAIVELVAADRGAFRAAPCLNRRPRQNL
jgi:hypothetical protein